MPAYEIRKNMVETHIERVMEFLKVDRGEALERLVYSWVFGCSIHEVPEEDHVDGGEDKQVDFIVVEDYPDDSRAVIHVMQVKAQPSFSSNSIIQLHNGLNWIWVQPLAKVDTLQNQRLKLRIREIRELLIRYGPANLDLNVYFVSLGNSDHVSSETLQETDNLATHFGNAGFRSFQFNMWGASELVDILNQREQAGRAINADIPIVYDVNKPSLIKYSAHGLHGGIFTVTGAALAKLVSSSPNQSIFDKNIRPYLGKNQVNQEIYRTCSLESEARYFWFLNNGITMVCDEFDVVQDADDPHIKAKNVQIVNGCQTSSTLAHAATAGVLKPNTSVLVKVFATKDVEFVERITFSTNSQTAIGARDLKANDQIQQDLQRLFQEKYGIFYERKVNEFGHLVGDSKRIVVSNEKIGQAYLAVGLRNPSVSRSHRYKIFREPFYYRIFASTPVEALFFSWSVTSFCAQQCKRLADATGLTDEAFAATTYGSFHVARILGALLMGNDAKWDKRKLDEMGNALLQSPGDYVLAFEVALEVLLDVLLTRPIDTDLNNYLKAMSIQGRINERVQAHFAS